MIHNDVWLPNSKFLSKLTLVLDHFFPLLLLLIDFLFLSNPVFLRRHAYVVAALLLMYLPINMYYSMSGKPPYSFVDWQSWKSLLIAVAAGCVFLLTFYILDWVTRIKLQYFSSGRNKAILHVLESQKFETAEGYKYSQYSTGDASMSKSSLSGSMGTPKID